MIKYKYINFLIKKNYIKNRTMIDVDPTYTYRGHLGPVLSVDIADDICYTGGLDSTIRSWKVPPKSLELYSKFGKYYNVFFILSFL